METILYGIKWNPPSENMSVSFQYRRCHHIRIYNSRMKWRLSYFGYQRITTVNCVALFHENFKILFATINLNNPLTEYKKVSTKLFFQMFPKCVMVETVSPFIWQYSDVTFFFQMFPKCVMNETVSPFIWQYSDVTRVSLTDCQD